MNADIACNKEQKKTKNMKKKPTKNLQGKVFNL